MRMKSQVFMFGKHLINPSPNFTERTLFKIQKLENRRRFISDCLMVVLVFAPFIIREMWRFARHDYFSVSGMPFSQTIITAYAFFLSSLAAYLLLAIGIIGAFICLFGSRFSSKLRFLTQISSQGRFRI